MKKISFGIAILSLIWAFAAPAFSQIIPPLLGDQEAPKADPKPNDVNPFTEPLTVSLVAKDADLIYYDINNEAEFDPGSAKSIDNGANLPELTETSVVRAMAYSLLGGYSEMVSWTYTKSDPPVNEAPSVAFLTPQLPATFAKGSTYALTASASDPDGPLPLTVKYQYSQSTGVWNDIGTGTAAGFSFNWTVGPLVATGATQLRAVATDGMGGTANHQIAVTVIAANVAPTVSILSPANNSSFVYPSSITIAASPADAGGTGGAITKVEFYKNGEAAPFATKTAAPWSTELLNPPVGSYSVTAVAYDNGSPPPQLHTTSAAAGFTVVANRPPKSVITFPENGKTYYAPFSMPITATVSDSDANSSISQVVFRNSNTVESVDAASPWSYSKDYPAGTYKFTATATDNQGDSAVSDTVRITVSANQAPVARAGADTAILWSTTAATTVALKGGTSSDPESTALKYEWTGPAGVTFTGGATATPTAAFSAPGVYTIILKVTDLGTPPASGSDQVIVTVNSKPAITSPLTASGTAATRFGYLMSATGFPAPALSATTPAWLTRKTGTDSLVGTPTVSGPVSVTLVATNASGTDTKTLNISISDSLSKPSITSSLAGTAKTGVAYSYTITAKGNPSPVFTVTSLPGGLTFNAAGGIISGTPTVSGPYTITLTATNSQGNDNKPFVLTINADPKITTNLFDSIVVTEKNKATFEIKTTGYPAVGYEWQYSASATGSFAKVGANSSIYSIESATMTSAGYYRVIVRNGSGPDATSKVCRLIVKALPIPISIVSPRMGSPSVVVGTWVPFKVKATGPPKLMFQWFKGSTAITAAPKEQDTLFIIPKAALSDAGAYYAKVTDGANPDAFKFSDTSFLSVQLPKLPKPYARPLSGAFYPSIKIAFANDTAGTAIYWTNNGTDPSQTNGTLFNGDSILVNTTKSFKARAYKANFQPSDISFDTYTYTDPGTVIKPQIRPLTPTFKVSMNCTLSTATGGATVYYTTDPAVPMAPFGASITLDRTTTIIAVARKAGMNSSDTLRMTYTLEAISSKVLTPTITAVSGDFIGSTKVALDCATDNSSIYYTKDGTSPDSSASRILYIKDAPFTLTASTDLRVVATRQSYLNSDIVSRNFRLIPGPITASVAPDFIFEKEFVVKLAAQPAGSVIRFTTEGSVPNAESPEFPAEGLTISNTTKISAIAVKDGVSSTVYSFSYTKKGGQLATPTPTTADNQSTFKDTTIITLYSTPNSKIHYTLNGDIPIAGQAKEYVGPFVIDTTVTLQAVATQAAFTDSKILVANYTLVPGQPTATPPGGSSPAAVKVKLKSISRRAKLFYTTDGSDPMPSNWSAYDSAQGISITASANLKAIAVAGNMASQVMEENYVIFGLKDTLLPPGQTAFLQGGYSLRNPEDQSAIVQIRMADAAPRNLVGFDGVQYIFTLSLAGNAANSGVEFPKLIFTSPSSDKRSMYKIDLSGMIFFLSGADTVSLQQPGSYFMGIDVAPPTITHRGQSFVENGFTQVTFRIDDNVANLSYDVKRNDDPALNRSQQYLFAGQDVAFNLKHPSGTLKPLYIQLIVSDYRTASFFPAETGTQFSLSQKLVGVKSPDSWFIGANAVHPFDFLSIPLTLTVQPTLKSLRSANPGADVQGVAWVPEPGNPVKGKYLPIPESETFRPGKAYWVGSRTRISSLSLASAETAPTNKGTFSVSLKNGWNQIANPHLEELYWPYSRTLEETYKGFAIKGLWEYNASEAKFKECESLVPWRGYFVYNYLGDTTVTLSPRPVTVWAMKKYGNAGKVSLSMGWGGTPSLRLGADMLSSDGLGREDEFSLPRHQDELSIRALRDGSDLNSDWVRLRPDGIQEWKIAMDGVGDSLPSLRVLAQELPDGHETWAVSLSRSMKFRLEQGRDIPSSGLAKDTLLIYSGSKDRLARFGLLQSMAMVAPSLDLHVSARNGGFNMRMFLPSKARIRATVWSLQGVRLGEMAMGPLSGGEYGFAYESDFRNRPARLAPGIYFLSVEVRGSGLQKRLARKLVIPN